MALSLVAIVVIIGAFLVGVRRLMPERFYLFQGMFRYDADLGWPRGVQEDDGERAWVPHEKPAWDPEEDTLAWVDAFGTSTIEERDWPLDPAAIVRVKARPPGEGAGLPSEGAAVARRMARRMARRVARRMARRTDHRDP